MANYYCMIAGLPDIDLQDTKTGLSIEDMREQCEEQLTPQDKKLLFYFFLRFDCVNLVKLLKNPEAEIDQWGNFTLEQLRALGGKAIRHGEGGLLRQVQGTVDVARGVLFAAAADEAAAERSAAASEEMV